MRDPEPLVSLPATGRPLVVNSRRVPVRPSPLGQLPPPELLLAVELLSNVEPTEGQIADLSQAVLGQAQALVPGAASIALEPTAGGNFFRVRIGIFSRLPNAAELAAAQGTLAQLALTTSAIPTRNIAIFVSLPVIDRAADEQLPTLQEKLGGSGTLADIDVRFDAAKNDLVTVLTFTRDGVIDGPWVATLTDKPVLVETGGPEVGGEPRRRFVCNPATVVVTGGLGRRRLENRLREAKPTGVLCELLARLQITTILLGPDPGDPDNPEDDQPPRAAELSWLAVDRAADGVRLTGRLALRLRVPEVRSIKPDRLLALNTAANLSVRLRATLLDLREPLDFEWSFPQGGSFPNPNSSSPSILFNLTGSDSGEVFEKQVKVEVTDVDGLTRDLTRTISVEIISEEDFPDELGDGKPDLP